MGTSPCCSREERLNRGAWTAQEDMILSDYIRIHGAGRWRNLPRKAGIKRCGKSCRLRWLNYLRPDIIRGNISLDEEDLIIRMHRLLGNRWSLIAGRVPGRTDNEIKNYWNTHLKKKLLSVKESKSKIIMSKPPPPLQNHVIKSRAARITAAVKQTETVSPNGCSNRISSDQAIEFPTIEEITNSSESWCNLIVNDLNIADHPERIAVPNLTDVNLVKTEVRNFTLADSHAANSAESLCDLNELSSPDSNLLSSPSFFGTDFGFEEFCSGTETKGFEGFCSTFAADEGRVETYDTTHHVDWIHELDYLWM